MRLEPATRAELRQVFEKDITGLIALINNIATAIYSKDAEGKLKRVLEEVNDHQAAILKTLGYVVEDGKVAAL
jgi:hypothetical protein